MNFSKSLLFIACASFVLTSCKDSESEVTTETADTSVETKTLAANPETASFNIEGMSCAVGCAKTIEKKLSKMDGVQHATVDYDTKTAKVEFDASVLTTESLIEAVESAADGKTYKVENVKSSKDQAMIFNNDPIKKDKKKKNKKSNKDNTDTAPATDGKKACCSSKKACSA